MSESAELRERLFNALYEESGAELLEDEEISGQIESLVNKHIRPGRGRTKTEAAENALIDFLYDYGQKAFEKGFKAAIALTVTEAEEKGGVDGG